MAKFLLKPFLKGLANGFGKEVGSALFKSVFSGSVLTKEELIDILRAELVSFSAEIKFHIDRRLTEERFKDAEVSLNLAMSLFDQYSASADSATDLLDDCVVSASKAAEAFAAIGAGAIHQYSVCVSLLIMVWQERIFHAPDQERVIEAAVVPDAVNKLRNFEAQLYANARKRVSYRRMPIYSEETGEPLYDPSSGDIVAFVGILSVDGEVIDREYIREPNGMRSLASKRAAYEERFSAELAEELEWLQELIQSWLQRYPIRPDDDFAIALLNDQAESI